MKMKKRRWNMKKLWTIFLLLIVSVLLFGCSQIKEVKEKVLLPEPSSMEVLTMYEEALKGNTESIKEYLGEVPGIVDPNASYEDIVDRQPELSLLTPEQLKKELEVRHEVLADVTFDNELIEEKDRVSYVKVKVTGGRDYASAAEAYFNHLMDQINQGNIISEEDSYNLQLEFMKTAYTIAEPSVVDVTLKKDLNGKWTLSDSDVIKIMKACIVAPKHQ